MEKITVIFVLGAPGSGKGTQCKRIVEKYGWTHLSTGDLLRKEVQAGSDLGQQVNDSMSMGQMVPTELILELLTSAMTSSGSSRFLVDGFPRTLDQLMDFQTQVKPCDGALVLTVPEEVAIDRLLGRGRANDHEDTIRGHMEVFQEESQPVIEFLADSGSNVHEVDAGVDEDDVWAAVQPFMDSMDELAADREAGRVSDDADSGPDGGQAGTAADAGDSAGGGFDDDSDPTSAAVADSLLDSVVVCVVGSPGADDGTQCDLIRRRYGWTHLSTSDLLKEEIGKGSELGQQIAQILVDGGEVPDAMFLAVVSAAMSNTPTAKRRFVLEGFPRRTEQILAFEARVKPCDGILVLSAPESVALIRMLARGTGEETEEEVQQRIEMFWSDVQPMVDLLKEQGASVAEIDASGGEEEVYEQVAAFIGRFGPPLTIAGEEEGEKQPEAGEGEGEEAEGGAAAAEEAERGAGGVGEDEYSPEQVEAVVRIQAAARGYQDRKKVAELRQAKQQQQPGDEEEGATKAEGTVEQAAAEEAQGGEEGGEQPLEGYSEEQVQAVIRIQAAARGYQDRKMVERIRADRQQQPQQQAEGEGAEGEGMEDEADHADGGDAAAGDALEGYSEEQVKAVIKIQAAARGYQDRKMVEQIRAGRQQAAQEVVAGAEGQGEEEEEEAEEGAAAAAEEAERGAGGVGEDEYSPEQVEAVVRIQAAARGYQDRKKVAELRQAKQQQQPGDEEEEEEEEQQQDEAGTIDTEAAVDVEQGEAAAAATAAAGTDEAQDESAMSYEEAVVRIQAAGRGYLDRKRVAKLREEADAHADEVAAAAEAAVEAEVAKQVNSIRAMLVVCGPSGVGKGTLIGRLMQQHSDTFGFSVSHTTRGPRPGEQDGVHYHFTNRESMQDDVDAGLFLEYADVHGNMYGTSLAAVAAVGRSGRIAVLDIDVQGATKIKASRAAAKARYLFVDPPSLPELEIRLRGRGTETEDKVQLRLANATAEIERSRAPGFFDARVTNDDLDAAYHRFKVTIEKLIPGTFKPEDLVLPTPPPPPPPPPQAPPQAPRASILTAQDASTPMAPQQQQPVSVAPKLAASVAMPVRQYMDVTVVPVLREALRALNEARPGDPLKFVADFLMAARANGGKPPGVDGNG